jgi:hypothetical protein
MDRPEHKCQRCGGEWVAPSPKQYAAVTAKLRSLDREASTPDSVKVCRGCGGVLVDLVSTFHAR